MAQDMDERFMGLALEQAQLAFEAQEVPVGAVVVKDGKVVARGFNSKESSRDPTAHAEMIALRQAAAVLGRWRLTDCSVYVSLEPCPMCAGAMLSARIARLVFGCADPKAGAVQSLYSLADDSRMNHSFEVSGGLMAQEASELLKSFFRARRANRSFT